MVDHHPVQRRAITVVRAVQLSALVGVKELDEAAPAAAHQRQGPFGESIIPATREHARQELSAQLEENVEPFAPAQAASSDLSMHRWPLDSSDAHENLARAP